MPADAAHFEGLMICFYGTLRHADAPEELSVPVDAPSFIHMRVKVAVPAWAERDAVERQVGFTPKDTTFPAKIETAAPCCDFGRGGKVGLEIDFQVLSVDG